MARRTNDPFDFSKARGSSGRTAFRTPQMSKTILTDKDRRAQLDVAIKNWDRGDVALQSVSPYRALAFYFAKLARAGIQGADEFAALNSAAARSATVARRIGATERQAGFGREEVKSILTDFSAKNPPGYSSKLFEDGVRQLFRPEEVNSILRSFAKLQGKAGATILGYGPSMIRAGTATRVGVGTAIFNAKAGGKILRDASRGTLK